VTFDIAHCSDRNTVSLKDGKKNSFWQTTRTWETDKYCTTACRRPHLCIASS